jgi:glucokinase
MSQGLLIGIDLGGTNCRAALVHPNGKIGESRRMPTRIHEGLEPLMGRLFGLCHELLTVAKEEGCRICAIGVGTAGVIGNDGSVNVSPNLPPLNGVPFAKRLKENLNLPVTVVNDANAIAWGEALFGGGRPFFSFLTVTLGTGVGGGLVLERRLWEGADGAAGEVGHIMVEPEGRICGCGSRGCLEQYASASGIVKSVREFLDAGEDSILSKLTEQQLTSHKVAEAARKGDRVALAALEEAGRRLGQVLGSVANLLNLEGVVITGGASESLDLMRPILEKEIKYRAFEVSARRLKIVRGELGDDAGILGAARIAYDRLPGSHSEG